MGEEELPTYVGRRYYWLLVLVMASLNKNIGHIGYTDETQARRLEIVENQ